MFQQPDKGGDFFSPRNHPEWLGRLFLIYPDSVATRTFKPEEGPTELVEGDVVIIDLPDPQTGQPTVIVGAAIGGKGLVPQIKKQVGGMVLGRLAQSAPQGQKSGAYFLADYSPQDEATAMAYVQAHPRQAFVQPQAQAPAPQYASQALPYDPWQHTGAQAPQPQGQAYGAQGQTAWGQSPVPGAGQPQPQGQPQNVTQVPGYGGPPAQQYAPQAAAPAAEALDPNLIAQLQARGIDATGMANAQMKMILSTFQ